METARTELAETAVTFIEDHLQDDITLADIAAAVSYSLFHFCRVFNQIVHHPPYDYLMRRRLTAAAQQLVESEQRITDIAFAYQFGSPESFSRAFRRMFGELPTQWRKQNLRRKQGIRNPRVLMKPLTIDHLMQRNEPDFHRPTLVEKEAFTMVGLMTIVRGDGETAVSASALQAVHQLRQQLSQRATHTIHHYPDFWTARGKPVLVGSLGKSSEPPLVSQTIPANAYACFALPERIEERPFLSDYIYQTWLPQSGYKLAAPLEIEHDQQLLVPIVVDG